MCYCAVVDMLTGPPQGRVANAYRNFLFEKTGIIDDLDYTEPWAAYFFDGVDFEYAIEFWNRLMSDNQYYWTYVESAFTLSRDYRKLPCLGILFNQLYNGECELHAILLHHVSISETRNGGFDRTLYYASLIDPQTGLPAGGTESEFIECISNVKIDDYEKVFYY